MTCRVLKITRQPYYRWLDRPVTDAQWRTAHLVNAIWDAHHDDPEVDYRLIADEVREAGIAVADRTVWKHCSVHRIWSVFGKKRGKAGRTGPPVFDDLVQRDFTADGPNQLWLADRTAEGKLYACVIKDAWSNRVVGYSISDRMKARLAVTALNNAVARRSDVTGCVVHTDCGSQFRSRKFAFALHRHAMIGSMGGVGAAGDNAAIESFFSLLPKNVLNRRRWATREQLRLAVVTWIERTYHRRRRQATLGRLPPIEYETIMNPTQVLVA